MSDLLIDAGNSRVKWGFRRELDVVAARAMPRQALIESGFDAVFESAPAPVTRALICNVAGNATLEALAAACNARAIDLIPARTLAGAGDVRIAYADPTRLGVDRWVAMIGAWALCPGRHVLIVDAGTACTIDALDAEGRHLGGMILPGLTMMRAALTERTSDIVVDAADLEEPSDRQEFFASDTSRAVRNGALAALAGAVEFSLGALPKDAATLLTGGDAPAILRHMPAATEHRPALVLEGLARLAATESVA